KGKKRTVVSCLSAETARRSLVNSRDQSYPKTSDFTQRTAATVSIKKTDSFLIIFCAATY
ncbi:hypothetical protein U4Z51_26280, partial [Escherichia coli]|nr:hypothetical protein [Escherichia coli]